MTRQALLHAHALGAALLGIGLVYGTWAWHCVRRLERAGQPAQAVLKRLFGVYLFVAVPGSLLLLGSGTWLIASSPGGWRLLGQPWLLAMLGVTLLEFTEGITVTRAHLLRAVRGEPSADELAPHLDLPLFSAVLLLGLWRPAGWLPVIGVLAMALAVALVMWQAARRGRF
jgi:hypothetical protein